MNGPLRFLQRAAVRLPVVVSIAISGVLASPLFAQTGIDLLPAEITAYQSFTARVTFAREYCISDTYPLLGEVDFNNGVLSVVISHLKPGTCRRSFTVAVPGLPTAATQLRISVSGRSPIEAASPAVLVESVDKMITVNSFASLDIREYFWTGRADYSALLNLYQVPPGSTDGPIVLTPTHGYVLSPVFTWLEVGTVGTVFPWNYTFQFMRFLGKNASIPSELTPLLFVEYPVPYRGYYASTDLGTVNRLRREWHGMPPISIDPNAQSTDQLVGRLVAGSCPVAMTPVYAAFHPVGIGHRYTQSAVTYRHLVSNGYVGDGAVWCAPAQG